MLGNGWLRWALALIAAVAVPLGLALSGVSQRLGAHPWWDVQTALIGGAIGAAAAVLLALVRPRWRGALGLIVLAVAGVAAWQGKTRFAASFAEDALAGRSWYLGWIGVATGLALLIAAILAPSRR